jgi:hypothetical protein
VHANEKQKCEQTDGPNSHAFGTFGTSPAEQALVPKASGSRSSGTLGKQMQTMTSSVPTNLLISVNTQVISQIEQLSAHSDVADALSTALKPLGDVQFFCPDSQEYRYVAASTKGVIFGLALGMSTIAYRLDALMKNRALATGAMDYPDCGRDWVSFTVFRDDWPKVDLEFWGRKAYVAARELKE